METVVQTIWTKSKLLVKALIIVFIVLILQLPTFYIRDLIEERESRQKEAIAEVSSKWAGKQNVTGPVLVLPYWQYEGDTLTSKIRRKHFASFLPDDLNINSTVTPQEKYRGIYKVMLYTANIKMSGNFREPALDKLNIAPSDVLWNEASVQFHLSDVKGLNDEMKVNWNGTLFPLLSNTSEGTGETLSSPLNLTSAEDLKNKTFSTEFNLNGSEQLLFTPVGKSTTTIVNSSWPHPSFTGNTLPQTTEVKDSGFTAAWKSLSHKRSFPQQWKDGAFGISKNNETHASNLASTSFGVNLFVPVNSYQKTMRSIKYAALCILLTFAAFFIIESTNKKSVHPFQYGLIGLALVMFYTLLLSFSEYIGFNISYVVASIATIGLIAWFVKGLLGSSRLTTILSFVLVLLYTYVFTILQLQDYSLILGSIGLFLALAVVMHFSKKIQW
jgi:inner membrane protein